MKEQIRKVTEQGEEIVTLNQKAVDRGISDLRKIEIHEEWASLPENRENTQERQENDFVHTLFIPIEKQMGDSIKVSV